MAKLIWDAVGERFYETGVDRGVLYVMSDLGAYGAGVAWNGLTAITPNPSGGEATKIYADNINYLTLYSAEEFGATVEALYYPKEFAICDGTASPVEGLSIGMQRRASFGLCYRTRLGNDTQGDAYGFKLHLIYGAKAAPASKSAATINESPEAEPFSWELTTTPVDVPNLLPTAKLTIDSTTTTPAKMTALMDILYGKDAAPGASPRLPLPAEVITILST